MVKDVEWFNVKEVCLKRSNYKCEITSQLTLEEKEFVSKNIYKELEILDGMHIIGRSQSNKLIYDPENVIIAKRYYHTLIDSFKDPFTLKSITKEERDTWFIRFIGIDRWNYLQDNK